MTKSELIAKLNDLEWGIDIKKDDSTKDSEGIRKDFGRNSGSMCNQVK